jgi:hypothetical protein
LNQVPSKTGAFSQWPEIMTCDYQFKMLQNDILIEKIRKEGGEISNNTEACGLSLWEWPKQPGGASADLSMLRGRVTTLDQYLWPPDTKIYILQMKWLIFFDIII